MDNHLTNINIKSGFALINRIPAIILVFFLIDLALGIALSRLLFNWRTILGVKTSFGS